MSKAGLSLRSSARKRCRPWRELARAQSDASSPLEAALLFEAEALREEIILVGRKLWERQYVDGNGGNISVRLGEKYLLCTPTMMSKRI